MKRRLNAKSHTKYKHKKYEWMYSTLYLSSRNITFPTCLHWGGTQINKYTFTLKRRVNYIHQYILLDFKKMNCVAVSGDVQEDCNKKLGIKQFLGNNKFQRFVKSQLIKWVGA